MGSSPPAHGSPPVGSDQLSPKSAWVSPLSEASVPRSKPVFNLVDGVARVSVPDEIVDEGLPLWKCFVVGYFMGDAPHLGTIHATVNRIWNSVGRSTHFRDVPGFLFSQKGLRFLADITGDFVRLHPNTERCTRLDLARILVEVNLEKVLTERICVEDKEGVEYMISVSYPWLPPRCTQCRSWGHKEADCSK
ncbi:unnamed protein product, partial [Arabidopsis halleri]